MTRAVIAYALPDGTWKGVWNDLRGDTPELGRVLIRRVSALKGDFDKLVAEVIEGCPEGWAALDKQERNSDPIGFLSGAFDGVVATCDGVANNLVFDTEYLYLFHIAKRRLYVFEVKAGPMRPFGMVTFEAAGKAKPTKLPVIEEEE